MLNQETLVQLRASEMIFLKVAIAYDSLVENFCTSVAYKKLKINLFTSIRAQN